MDQIWIIRVKGRISGPFNSNEVIQMIESKKLSIKDEVNKPLKQWIYVKNASELYKASDQTTTEVPLVKKRRTKKNWMEDTVILDSPAQSEELKELEELEETEHTKTAEVIEKEKEQALSKELDLKNAEVIDYKVDEFTNTPQKSSAQFETIDQAKKKVSVKSQKAAKSVWMIIFILSIGALFFYFSKYVPLVKAPVVSELPAARKLFDQGFYEKSLMLFKKSTIENDSDRLKLASMLVQMEGDIYQAQLHIEKIKNLSPLEEARLQILKGIIEYKNNKPDTAEAFFNESLSPFLGTLHKVMLNIKDPAKALSILNETDFSEEESKNLLLLLKAYLEPPHTEEPSALTKLLTSNNGHYKQEALLLLLYRQRGDTDPTEYHKTVQQVLDQDPYLTREYKSDILSYTPHFVWKELLLDICSSITAKEASYFIALKSLCLTQSGQHTKALRHIEKARVQSPKDPLISSVYVFVSSQNNLDEYTLLDHALKQNQNYVLPFILKARFCQSQQDTYCAHNYWSQVRSKNNLSLSAIAGEAWGYSKMGNNKSAQDLIQQGFLLSNQYKPLIQLKEEFEGEGEDDEDGDEF